MEVVGRKMKAVRLHSIGDFRVDEVPIPKPSGSQLLVKIGACGICGSDIPRIFELGTSKQKYPLTLGHEFSGIIVDVGECGDKSLIGRRGAIFPCIPCRKCTPCINGHYAMCEDYDYLGSRSDGGFAEYCLVPGPWHFVESKNPDTSMDSLAMVEPCTVAQHAVRKGGITAGSSVLIFGAGPIGIMAGRWARMFGADPVVLVDIVDEKVIFASERGMIVLNGIKQDIVAGFKKLNNGRKADVIIEGTGTGEALGQAVDAAKIFGTIVLMGNPHKDTTIKLSQHSNILRKQLILQGIWNSHYTEMPVNEWKYTVEMMDKGKMVVEDLITHRCDLDVLPQLCRDIYDKKVTVCKALYSRREL